MARQALRPCRKPGCPALVPRGYCKAHQQAYERARGSSSDRGYGKKWQQARAGFLRAHPICVDCPDPATEVDHQVPHHGDMKLFWDKSNWRQRCKPCHSRKTVATDGGFGR